MPLNFPNSPIANDSFTLGTNTWIYNGYGWKLQQIQLANTEVSSFTTTADGATSTFDLQFSPIGGNSAVFVSIGGIVQSESDYVINSGNNTISFTSPPPISEVVRVAGYKTVTPYAVDAANSVGAVVNANNFLGDGTTQSFALGYTPYTANNIFVTIGGIVQPDSAYTTNNQNSSISFNTPPGLNENIRVVGYSKVNPFIINYATQNVTVSVFETTSNGTTNTFDVGFDPAPKEKLLVTIDGVVQPLTAYGVSSSNNGIILDEIPTNGELVRVLTFYTNVNTINIINATGSYANAAFNTANAAFVTANSAGIYANGAFVTANAAATTGKAIAMSIVFGG
jgi:hypothetical protein